jgi:hypothetical protein
MMIHSFVPARRKGLEQKRPLIKKGLGGTYRLEAIFNIASCYRAQQAGENKPLNTKRVDLQKDLL